MSELDNLGVQDVLGDRYVLEAELGRGAMGAVFEAHDRHTGARVAVKLLHAHVNTREKRARFLREARLAAQIRHPNVVRVLDYARADERVPYLVMELVRGGSMSDLIRQPVPAPLACIITIQVLRALGHVHAAGIVHRDIKPGNVLITHHRCPGSGVPPVHVRLVDFGIARLVDSDTELTQLTADGQILGTPAYMAPEQVSGPALIGPVADLYAVGVCLYRMVAGHRPFEGPLVELLTAKVSEALPSPRNLDAWPAGLFEVVRRLSATKPEDRYAFAADAAAALAPFATFDDAGGDDDRGDDVGDETRDDLLTDATIAQLDPVDAPAPAPELGKGPFDPERWGDVWGRAEVVARLAEHVAEVERGAAACVLLSGAVGQGKSSLATRFVRNLAEDGRFQNVIVDLRPSGSVSTALRAAIERLVNAGSDGPARVRGKLGELLRQLGTDDDKELDALVGFVRPGGALAIAEGQDALPRHISLFVRLLRRLATRRPVVLVIDDLDRAEADGVTLVDQILHDVDYEPFALMVLACTRRTAILDLRLSNNTSLARVELAPLDSQALIDGLSLEYGLGLEAARRIALKASGNPYFARLLAETSLASVSGGLDTDSLGSDDLPDQLRRVVAGQLDARLEGLSDQEAARAVLARLAILGSRAEVELLERLVGDDSDGFDDVLDRLIEAGILHEELDGAVVTFEHDLVRDVVLDGLTRRRFRKLHERAAVLREAQDPDSDAQAAAIGHHLAAAGASDRAVDWWLRGLAHAARIGDLRQVLDCGQRVLRSLADDDPRALQCGVPMARAHRFLGNLDAACRLARIASASADPLERARALEVIADCEQERSRMEAWSRALAELDELAEGAAPEVQRIRDRARLFWLNITGRGEQARALGQRMLASADHFGDAAYVHGRLFWTWFRGRFEAPEQALVEAERHIVAGDDDAHDPEAESDLLRRRLLLAMSRDRAGELLRISEEAIAVERSLGRWGRLTRVYVDRAFMLLQVGSAEQIEHALREAERYAAKAESASDRVRLGMVATIAAYLVEEREPRPESMRALLDDTDIVVLQHRDWLTLCLVIDAAEAGEWSRWSVLLDELDALSVSIAPSGLVEQVIERSLDSSRGSPHEPRVRERLRTLLELAARNWAPSMSERLDAVLTRLRAMVDGA